MTKVPVPYILEILIFLFAAVTIAPLFKKMKLSPVLGYLVAGSIIGPYALGVVDDIERVQNVAELGVIFLLFIIGLELPMERLKTMRRYVFGLGLSQVLCTMMLFSGVCMMMGFSVEQALVIGGALALSSTALVIELLSERNELSAKHGRGTFSVLLFQDLAVVPILALVLILSAQGNGESSTLYILGLSLGKAILAIGGIMLFGRYILRPVYRYFSSINNPEIFTAATLLIVLGVSAGTGYMGLSMALGAFLAGMLIAETEYRHQVEKDILPFQGLLLGLFFMAVGMSIDYSMIAENAALLAQLLFGLLLIKGVLVLSLARAFNFTNQCSLRMAAYLCQGGEFAFVILKVALTEGLLDRETVQLILVMVALSMALTPLIITIIGKLTAPSTTAADQSLALDKIAQETHTLNHHVIIAGFGRVGKTVASMLEKQNIPYVSLDTNDKKAKEAKEQKLPVFCGDAGLLPLLEAAGADKASVIIVTMQAPKTARKILILAQTHFPNAKVIIRGKDDKDCQELAANGAHICIPESLGSSIQLGKAAISAVETTALPVS